MISSQCHRRFPAGGRTLSELRQEIRQRLEDIELLGQPLFEVWINEDAPAAGLERNSWEVCMEQVAACDILLVLNSGHAGWALETGDIGICHSELMTARNGAPGKIRLISLKDAEPAADENAARNKRFVDYTATVNSFSPPVRTEAELMEAVDRALLDAVTSLVGLGVREARKGAYYSGDALTWSKLSYAERSQRMTDTVSGALVASGAECVPDGVVLSLNGRRVMLAIHAAPAGLSVPASREAVGRPFRADHLALRGAKPKDAGPVHLIACQGGTTEAQARVLLGHSDATVVNAPFGVFVADEVQKIQFVLLKNCRDITTTRNALHRFLDWLREAAETDVLLSRAAARRRIVDVIAREQSRPG